MKRIICSIMMALLIFAAAVFPAVNVNAAGAIPEAPADYGDPISETVYEDEDGSIVTEKLYFCPTFGATARSDSGSGWYKNEKTKEWTCGGTTTYYAQGYFVWGNGDVSVSDPSGDTNEVEHVIISNEEITSGTGRYAGVFNKYAYVTYSFTASSDLVGMPHDFSVTIRISQSGNQI